jgi:hypothetical protein
MLPVNTNGFKQFYSMIQIVHIENVLMKIMMVNAVKSTFLQTDRLLPY